jgi:hypothetical protein
MQPYGSKIFEISASILATAIVFFFTLILIPIQQYANRYSSSLSEYFRKDRSVIEVMALLFASFLFNAFMLFVNTITIYAVISFTLLICSICGIFLLSLHIMRMLNPSDYLLPKIESECARILKKGLREKQTLDAQQKLQQLDEQMQQVLLVTEKVDPNEKYWKVSRSITDELLRKVLPLKSMAMKLIETSDYEVFEGVVHTIERISATYLKERQNYKSFHDAYLFSLSETLKDILKTAEMHGNISFTRLLFSTVRNIAVSTCAVKVLGRNSGYNHLTQPLCLLLQDRAQTAVLKGDKDRAYDSTADLGDIGIRLAVTGTGHSAGEIVLQLGRIAALCDLKNDTITLVPIRKSLADIFFFLLWNRKLYGNYHLPFKKMFEVYEIMLNIPVDAGTALSIGDPLFSWNPDLNQDRGLSTLVYAALFSPYSDDRIVEHNLDVVNDIIGFIRKGRAKKNNINTISFIQHLYQVGLWLLAFIDKEITLEMTITQTATIPIDKNKKEANKILLNVISYMADAYFESIKNKEKEEELLFSCLSLFALTLHLDKAHNLGLTQGLDGLLENFAEKMQLVQQQIDLTDTVNIRHFCNFLKRVGKKAIADKIQATVKTKKTCGDIYELFLFNRIKRPIVTFDASLFARFDREIFGENGEVPLYNVFDALK